MGSKLGFYMFGLFGCLYACMYSPSVLAVTPQSPNYRFDEASIGNGSLLESSSQNFRSTTSLGNISSGAAASSNFQVEAGSPTSPDPNLSVTVDSAGANFGSFSASGTATANASFSVTNYTSYGYVVQILGDTPRYGSHTIAGMGSSAFSQPGTEQFGLNLVANTSPSSFGSNPNNGAFGFGTVAPNYSVPNKFRYVSGETIAQAQKSSGKTSYTLSYIVNVSALTPGGVYTSDQTLVITGTY